MAVGDFNGDGKQDLAVANAFSEHRVDLSAYLRTNTHTNGYPDAYSDS